MKKNGFLLGALAGLLCVMGNTDSSWAMQTTPQLNSAEFEKKPEDVEASLEEVEANLQEFEKKPEDLEAKLKEVEENLKNAYKNLENKIAQSQDTFADHENFLRQTIERCKLTISKNGLYWDISDTSNIPPSRFFAQVTRSFVLVGFDHYGYDRATVANTIIEILNPKGRLVSTEDDIYEEICKAWLETENSGLEGIKSNQQLEQNLHQLKIALFKDTNAKNTYDLKDNVNSAGKVFWTLSRIYLAWGNRTLPLEKSLFLLQKHCLDALEYTGLLSLRTSLIEDWKAHVCFGH